MATIAHNFYIESFALLNTKWMPKSDNVPFYCTSLDYFAMAVKRID